MADPGEAAEPERVEPMIEPYGDAALLVTVGSAVAGDPALAARCQAAAAALQTARSEVPALGRPVPAHATVVVPFDPLAIALEDAIDAVRRTLADPAVVCLDPGRDEPAIEIAVRYGGPDGPDLEAVAELHGLRPSDVVELHATAIYRVLFLGFAPGFGYLGGLPAALATPRRASPRERVPPGSVGIAGVQTAVYPSRCPAAGS